MAEAVAVARPSARERYLAFRRALRVIERVAGARWEELSPDAYALARHLQRWTGPASS